MPGRMHIAPGGAGRRGVLCVRARGGAQHSLTVAHAADLQAAVQRDEAGGEKGADAKHKALHPVPYAAGLPKHPGMTQAGVRKRGQTP